MATVTFLGKTMQLSGNLPQVGAKAPDFSVLDNALNEKNLADYNGKIVVLICVPSLDTPVCDTEVRRFNKEAANLSEKVQILAVSCDLPFAQARWCGAAGVNAVATLSDHRQTSLGLAYGVLLTDLRLLTRSIFVIDADGNLAYSQIVPEVTQEPDYDAALAAIKKLA